MEDSNQLPAEPQAYSLDDINNMLMQGNKPATPAAPAYTPIPTFVPASKVVTPAQPTVQAPAQPQVAPKAFSLEEVQAMFMQGNKPQKQATNFAGTDTNIRGSARKGVSTTGEEPTVGFGKSLENSLLRSYWSGDLQESKNNFYFNLSKLQNNEAEIKNLEGSISAFKASPIGKDPRLPGAEKKMAQLLEEKKKLSDNAPVYLAEAARLQEKLRSISGRSEAQKKLDAAFKDPENGAWDSLKQGFGGEGYVQGTVDLGNVAANLVAENAYQLAEAIFVSWASKNVAMGVEKFVVGKAAVKAAQATEAGREAIAGRQNVASSLGLGATVGKDSFDSNLTENMNTALRALKINPDDLNAVKEFSEKNPDLFIKILLDAEVNAAKKGGVEGLITSGASVGTGVVTRAFENKAAKALVEEAAKGVTRSTARKAAGVVGEIAAEMASEGAEEAAVNIGTNLVDSKLDPKGDIYAGLAGAIVGGTTKAGGSAISGAGKAIFKGKEATAEQKAMEDEVNAAKDKPVEPSTEKVEPSPAYPLWEEHGSNIPPEKITDEVKKAHAEWSSKYGTTHNIDGSPKTAEEIDQSMDQDELYVESAREVIKENTVEPRPVLVSRGSWELKYGKTHLPNGRPKTNLSDAVMKKMEEKTAAGWKSKRERIKPKAAQAEAQAQPQAEAQAQEKPDQQAAAKPADEYTEPGYEASSETVEPRPDRLVDQKGWVAWMKKYSKTHDEKGSPLSAETIDQFQDFQEAYKQAESEIGNEKLTESELFAMVHKRIRDGTFKSKRKRTIPAPVKSTAKPTPAAEAKPAPETKPDKKPYFKGDAGEYTGKTKKIGGKTFYEIKLTEGHLKGQTKLIPEAPEPAPAQPAETRTVEDMQDQLDSLVKAGRGDERQAERLRARIAAVKEAQAKPQPAAAQQAQTAEQPVAQAEETKVDIKKEKGKNPIVANGKKVILWGKGGIYLNNINLIIGYEYGINGEKYINIDHFSRRNGITARLVGSLENWYSQIKFKTNRSGGKIDKEYAIKNHERKAFDPIYKTLIKLGVIVPDETSKYKFRLRDPVIGPDGNKYNIGDEITINGSEFHIDLITENGSNPIITLFTDTSLKSKDEEPQHYEIGLNELAEIIKQFQIKQFGKTFKQIEEEAKQEREKNTEPASDSMPKDDEPKNEDNADLVKKIGTKVVDPIKKNSILNKKFNGDVQSAKDYISDVERIIQTGKNENGVKIELTIDQKVEAKKLAEELVEVGVYHPGNSFKFSLAERNENGVSVRLSTSRNWYGQHGEGEMFNINGYVYQIISVINEDNMTVRNVKTGECYTLNVEKYNKIIDELDAKIEERGWKYDLRPGYEMFNHRNSYALPDMENKKAYEPELSEAQKADKKRTDESNKKWDLKHINDASAKFEKEFGSDPQKITHKYILIYEIIKDIQNDGSYDDLSEKDLIKHYSKEGFGSSTISYGPIIDGKIYFPSYKLIKGGQVSIKFLGTTKTLSIKELVQEAIAYKNKVEKKSETKVNNKDESTANKNDTKTEEPADITKAREQLKKLEKSGMTFMSSRHQDQAEALRQVIAKYEESVKPKNNVSKEDMDTSEEDRQDEQRSEVSSISEAVTDTLTNIEGSKDLMKSLNGSKTKPGLIQKLEEQISAAEEAIDGGDQQALSDATEAMSALLDELSGVRDELQDKHDNTPESLQDTDAYYAREEAIDSLTEAIDTIESSLSNLNDSINIEEDQSPAEPTAETNVEAEVKNTIINAQDVDDFVEALRIQYGDTIPLYHATDADTAAIIDKEGFKLTPGKNYVSYAKEPLIYFQIGKSDYQADNRPVLYRLDVPLSFIEKYANADMDGINISDSELEDAGVDMDGFEDLPSEIKDIIRYFVQRDMKLEGMELLIADRMEDGNIFKGLKPVRVTAETNVETEMGKGDFNLSGEEATQVKDKAEDTTGDMIPDTVEPAYVAQARTQLAKLEKSGKSPKQQETLRETIATYEASKNTNQEATGESEFGVDEFNDEDAAEGKNPIQGYQYIDQSDEDVIKNLKDYKVNTSDDSSLLHGVKDLWYQRKQDAVDYIQPSIKDKGFLISIYTKSGDDMRTMSISLDQIKRFWPGIYDLALESAKSYEAEFEATDAERKARPEKRRQQKIRNAEAYERIMGKPEPQKPEKKTKEKPKQERVAPSTIDEIRARLQKNKYPKRPTEKRPETVIDDREAVVQYEEDRKLFNFDRSVDLSVVSTEALEDFENLVRARSTEITSDADGEFTALAAMELERRKLETDDQVTSFGDIVADLRSLANQGIFLPTLPSEFNAEELEKFKILFKRNKFLFRNPKGMDIGKVNGADQKLYGTGKGKIVDRQHIVDMKNAADGMISDVAQALAGLGWTQLDPSNVGNFADVLAELIANNDEGVVPEGGVMGATRDMDNIYKRKYTPTEPETLNNLNQIPDAETDQQDEGDGTNPYIPPEDNGDNPFSMRDDLPRKQRESLQQMNEDLKDTKTPDDQLTEQEKQWAAEKSERWRDDASRDAYKYPLTPNFKAWTRGWPNDPVSKDNPYRRREKLPIFIRNLDQLTNPDNFIKLMDGFVTTAFHGTSSPGRSFTQFKGLTYFVGGEDYNGTSNIFGEKDMYYLRCTKPAVLTSPMLAYITYKENGRYEERMGLKFESPIGQLGYELERFFKFYSEKNPNLFVGEEFYNEDATSHIEDFLISLENGTLYSQYTASAEFWKSGAQHQLLVWLQQNTRYDSVLFMNKTLSEDLPTIVMFNELNNRDQKSPSSNIKAASNSGRFQSSDARFDYSMRENPTAPDGQVANHSDADLASRGFISKYAKENMPSGMRLTFTWDVGNLKEFKKIKQTTNYTGGMANGDIKNEKGETVAVFEFDVEAGGLNYDGGAVLHYIKVTPSNRNLGLSKVIVAEIAERARRLGATTISATVLDPKQRPMYSMQSVLGNVNVTEQSEERADPGNDYSYPDQSGNSVRTRTEVTSDIDQDTPLSLKEIQENERKAAELDRRIKLNAANKYLGTLIGRRGYQGVIDRAVFEARKSGKLTEKEIQGLTSILNYIGSHFFKDVKLSIDKGDANANAMGQYDSMQKIIKVFKTAIESGIFLDTAAHEIAHHLTQFLPEADRAALRKEWKDARTKFLKANPGFASLVGNDDRNWANIRIKGTDLEAANKLFPDISKNKLFAQIPNSDPKAPIMYRIVATEELYRLFSSSEWFAETFKDTVMSRLNSDPAYTGTQKTWKDKLINLWENIKMKFRQMFGKDQAARILANFAKGRYDASKFQADNGTNVNAEGYDVKTEEDARTIAEVDAASNMPNMYVDEQNDANNEGFYNSLKDAEDNYEETVFVEPRNKETSVVKKAADFVAQVGKGISSRMHRYARKNPNSPTVKKLANWIHNRAGTKSDAFERDIPTSIAVKRTYFINKFKDIMGPMREQLDSFKNTKNKTAKQLREEVYKHLTDMITGRVAITQGPLGDAATQLKALLEEIRDYRVEAGEEIGFVEDYFPAVYNQETIINNRAQFVGDATAAYMIELNKLSETELAKELGLSKEEIETGDIFENADELEQKMTDLAQMKAIELYNSHVRGEASDIFDNMFSNRGSVNIENPAKSRKFSRPAQDIMRKWQVNDPFRVVQRYIMGSVKRAELIRKFGMDNTIWKKMAAQMEQDGVNYNVITDLAQMIRVATGSDRDDRSIGWRNTSQGLIDTMTLITAASAMGKGFWNNLAEPISIGIRSGSPIVGSLRAYAETWGVFIKLATKDLTGRKERGIFANSFWEQYGKDMGLIHNNLEDAWMTTHSIDSGGEESNPRMRWLTNAIYKANLMDASETAKQRASLSIGNSYIANLANLKQGNHWFNKLIKKLNLSDEKWNPSQSVSDNLNELGIPQERHDEFTKWVISIQNLKGKALMSVITGNSEMARFHQEAIVRFSNQSSVRSSKAHKTVMQNTFPGKVLLQLLSFAYSYAAEVGSRVLDMTMQAVLASPEGKRYNMVDRMRMLAPVMGAALSVVVYRGLFEFKDWLYETEGAKIRKKFPEWLKWFNALSYSGLLGPRIEQLVKVMGRDMTVGGPAGSVVANTGKAVAAGFKAATGQASGESAVKAARTASAPIAKSIVVGGASALNPALGAAAIQATNQPEFQQAIVGPKAEKSWFEKRN